MAPVREYHPYILDCQKPLANTKHTIYSASGAPTPNRGGPSDVREAGNLLNEL